MIPSAACLVHICTFCIVEVVFIVLLYMPFFKILQRESKIQLMIREEFYY
jgi:hypothetical protein